MIDALQRWAGERGHRLACGDVSVLPEVRSELHQRKSTGELDAGFFDSQLSFFRYEQSAKAIAHPRSVIVVALHRPAHRVTFELETGPFDVILPPTYLRYQATFREVRDDLVSAIPALRGHLEIVVAPLKAIASRLGLVSYGRNKVTYIAEFGSYFQLVGYVTDAELGIAAGGKLAAPELMPECDTCGICAGACPTGSIGDGRVLLHAEHCTTLFSEQSGALEHALSAPCLFGCLECQQICPVNTGRLRVESAGVSFTADETQAILRGGPDRTSAASKSIRTKLDLLGLTEEPLIARNLAHLIARQRGTLTRS